MFGFTYDTWRETCEMYFKLGDGSKKAFTMAMVLS